MTAAIRTHTPAPWRFEESTRTIRSVPANYWLATMNSWDGAVNHAANARLIAASPDMLYALTRVIAHIDLTPAGRIARRLVLDAIEHASGAKLHNGGA